MLRVSIAAVRVFLPAFSLLLLATTPLHAQRSDRATISGVVSDNQGAAVQARRSPSATRTGRRVGARDQQCGAYNSPPLVLGRYAVTVDLTGFKKTHTTGILLEGGSAIRHDVALQVGDLTESVEVRASEGVAETRTDGSHTVDEKTIRIFRS